MPIANFRAGCAIDYYYQSAVATSHLHNVHNVTPMRSAYFARKSNIFNQYFVKKAWGWTVGLYLLHLATSPGRPPIPSPAASAGRINPALHATPMSKRRSRAQRLTALIISTLAWLIFSAWFFGAALGDRIIQYSGGICSIPLPEGTVDLGALEPLLPPGHNNLILHTPTYDPHVPGSAAKERVYFPLPEDFCAHHLPLTHSTHPRLIEILAAAHGLAHDAHAEIHKLLRLPPPRWSGGFDVSGHAFLLTLGAIILSAELAPSWRAALAKARGRDTRAQSPGIKQLIHTLSTIAGSALVLLWVWMLFMTAIYFHDFHEKVAGLALGLFAAAAVNFSIPSSSSPVIEYKIRGPTRRPTREGSGIIDDAPLSPIPKRRLKIAIEDVDEDAFLPDSPVDQTRDVGIDGRGNLHAKVE